VIRAPNVPTPDMQRERLRDAARSLEAMVLKHLVTASGAFTGGEGPGAAIRSDLFATTLADALASGGSFGLAAQIERSLAGDAPASAAHAPAVRAPAPLGPRAVRGEAPAGATPVDGRISSAFGPRADPFTGEPRHHAGVDFAAPEGSEIRAARAGRVVFAGPRGGYGNAVEIDHGEGLTTLYAHASDLLVRSGDAVLAGQPIARVGMTGRATGAHLHFEVRQDHRPQDPGRALIEYRRRADEVAGAGS
jgi:murein DD-endopeptidase MepM/ murein hydrolase activator NlpD